MKKRRRFRATALSAAATAVVVVVAYLTVPTASANVGGPVYGPSRPGADPHIFRCTDPATPSVLGYCMVTSSDMGQQFTYPENCVETGTFCWNYYPMSRTFMYYSPTGLPNTWVDKGSVVDETDIPWVPDGDSAVGEVGDALHQWAPSAHKWGNYYYLYVPNVPDISSEVALYTKGDIAVWRSESPFGPYEYRGHMSENGDFGYMSDPDVLVDGANRYLVWATGAPKNCGEFKTAVMTGHKTIDPATIETLDINGLDVLGSCDPDGPIGPVGRPYVEGASLYKFDDPQMPGPYTLVFPVKPDDTDGDGDDDAPKECSGNTNSVIAYATSDTPDGSAGPDRIEGYTYRGIIMCGSTTEWTNQATITKVDAFGNNAPYVIAYHDSPASVKMRHIHAECLFAGGGMIAGVYRQPQDAQYGFNDCVGDGAFAFSGMHVVDPEQSSKPTILTAPNAGADAVVLSKYAVGPWERFKLFERSDGTWVIQSLANKKYLCSNATFTALKASCTSSSAFGARFNRFDFPDGGFQLQSSDFDKYVSVHSDGQLFMDSIAERGDTPAMFTEMKLR